MASYSPANGTVEHLEFTDIHNTISIADEKLHQWLVQQVTGYDTSNGIRFDDLTFSVPDPENGSKSWSYSSLFEYAVNRVLRYVIYHEDTNSLEYGEVDNIPKLPPRYDSIYVSLPPDPEMQVTMHLTGLQRTGTEQSSGGDSSDSGGGSGTTISWGPWVPWSDDYTITITTSLEKHLELLQRAIEQQTFVKNSPTKPDWPSL